MAALRHQRELILRESTAGSAGILAGVWVIDLPLGIPSLEYEPAFGQHPPTLDQDRGCKRSNEPGPS